MSAALLTLALLALLWLKFALARRRVDKARHAVAAAYDRRQRVRRNPTEAQMKQWFSMLNVPYSQGVRQAIRPSDD